MIAILVEELDERMSGSGDKVDTCSGNPTARSHRYTGTTRPYKPNQTMIQDDIYRSFSIPHFLTDKTQ